MGQPGRIVILNGAPRAGKSSIVRALQARTDGIWVNLGVDIYNAAIPARLLPGIGLRPGGERPELEPLLPQLYGALYEAMAAHSRLGLDVVADLGHHDDYSTPLGLLPACARRLAGLPALLVGVHCPIDIIMARRNADPQGGLYAGGDDVPAPVRRWQDAVHVPGIYDLRLDTGAMRPEACAEAIMAALAGGVPQPGALGRLAAL